MQVWRLLLVGFVLCVLGVLLPFLMLLQVIPSTLLLNFFSFAASMSGLLLGIIGASRYARVHRK